MDRVLPRLSILATFRFDYEYHFLAFELVMLASRSSAVLVVNRRFHPRKTATKFQPRKSLRPLVKNLVAPKRRTRSQSRIRTRSRSRTRSRTRSRSRNRSRSRTRSQI